MDDDTISAVKRLLTVAAGDSGQSKRAANFLLAWWNAGEFGGFDLTDLSNVDAELRADMVTVFNWLAAQPMVRYPSDHEAEFRNLVVQWRSHLLSEAI